MSASSSRPRRTGRRVNLLGKSKVHLSPTPAWMDQTQTTRTRPHRHTPMTLASLAGLATALGGPILTLEGGGFRAQSVDAGFMAGMLAFAGREKSQARPTFESTGLFKRFAAVSTNSGSSWFFSELAYSASFKALIEEMAAKPDKAAEAYSASWTSKWLAATNVTDSKFNLLGDLAHLLVKELLGTGDEDSIYMVRYFLGAALPPTRFTWARSPFPRPRAPQRPASRGTTSSTCCSTRPAPCRPRGRSARRPRARGPTDWCGSWTTAW